MSVTDSIDAILAKLEDAGPWIELDTDHVAAVTDFASEAMSVLRAWVRHQDSVDAAIIGGGGEPMPSPYREVLERARVLLRGAGGGGGV